MREKKGDIDYYILFYSGIGCESPFIDVSYDGHPNSLIGTRELCRLIGPCGCKLLHG